MYIGCYCKSKNNPISGEEIYEGAIKAKEIAISNMQVEFQFNSGVCGKFTLKFITLDGKSFMKNYDS
ncbi:hypothetical protein CQZ94_21435 [Bacillus sp. MYb209]|nr:hypothetical protein CQZ94_21435 [Bacillus sp. MYb209]